ncbi:biotin--[acetyl-CoA-carboxylase] ligase [Muriicola sp. SD30]|uniref:biotin--[acetyl-CoA-carboxylase] ligase n=1 Tax=Muriicola sp. SD30 TaxID=3240936 RepID=UPI00350FFA22
MQVIKVNATDSTNLHLKRLMAETTLSDFTVLVADSQLQGIGQAGTNWTSEPGKNLTVSVLKYFKELRADQGFSISMALSLSLIELFEELEIPELAIKWPNDIMSGNKKICGILIENTLKGFMLKQSVLGIGINVNQEKFKNLPNAASLKQITGKSYPLDKLLNRLLDLIQESMEEVEQVSKDLSPNYESLLYMRDQQMNYEINGKQIVGAIKGVSPEGRLMVEAKGGKLLSCGLKEIRYPL